MVVSGGAGPDPHADRQPDPHADRQPDPHADPSASPGSSQKAPAPGRHAPFRVDPRWTVGYRVARFIVETVVRLWFRPRITGSERVPAAGPVVLAPVHRSFADFVFTSVLTDRKLFFMAKDTLWRSRALGRLMAALGAFPVHREGPDREALARAQEVLEAGQVLVMFPEGTRQVGPTVEALHDGVAFLAGRTGAPMVPIGIGGSDRSMPKGSKIPKPIAIDLVVGEPLPAPVRGDGGRLARSRVRETSVALRGAIQAVYDEARAGR